MATASEQEQGFSADELERLTALIEKADSVELKLTVPEESQRSALAALGLDPLQAELRQVFFFDTPDLSLNQRGVVVRARRVQRKGDDSVVKLRPVVPAELPRSVRKSPAFGVEVDAMPGGFVCSGSMKRTLPKPRVHETIARGGPYRKLFSKEQRAFYAEHAGDAPGLDELTVLGPIFVLKLRFSPSGFARRLVAEMWLYPDNTRVLELSTKCAPSKTFQVAEEARAFLGERGISLSGEQATKTRKALDFYSMEVGAAAAEPDA